MILQRHQYQIQTNQRTVFAALPCTCYVQHHPEEMRWFLISTSHICGHTDPGSSIRRGATYLSSRTGQIMDSDVVRKSTEDCVICLDKIQKKKTLKCFHSFCSECIDSVFKLKPACPICNTYHGKYTGTQPDGTMTVTRNHQRLPGFESCGSITIQYSFPAGIQGVRLTD